MCKKIVKMCIFMLVLGVAAAAQAQYTDYVGAGNWDGSMTAVNSSQVSPDHGAINTVDGSGLVGIEGSKTHSIEHVDAWHSDLNQNSIVRTAPSGTTCYEWVSYDFGQSYDLGTMWVWNMNQIQNSGAGLADVTIDYSVNGTDWTTLGTYTWPRSAAGRGLETADYMGFAGPDFAGLEAQYVVIAAHTNYGEGYWGLSEVRFDLFDPNAPPEILNPYPANGQKGVELDVILTWDDPDPEPNVVANYLYDVYFGLDPVFDGESPVSLAQSGLSYDSVLDLDLDTTYYWRVDVLDPITEEVLGEGDVLSFTTTQGFHLLDPVAFIDDHFDGDDGDPLDANNWLADSPGWGGLPPDPTLDGDSNVDAAVGTGFRRLYADPAKYSFAVSETKAERLSLRGLDIIGGASGANFGLGGVPNFGTPCIQWRTDLDGSGLVTIEVTDTVINRVQTSVSGSADGNVDILHYQDKVLVYFNNAKIYDSRINAPTAVVPTVELAPQLGSMVGFKIDEVVWRAFDVCQIQNAYPARYAEGIPVDVTMTWDVPDCNDIPSFLYDVYFGTDPNFADDTPVLAGTSQTSYTPASNLLYKTDYFWRVDVIDPNNGSPYVFAEGDLLDFSTLAPKAHTPVPGNGATGVDPTQVLGWSYAGDSTYTYDVYFSTSATEVDTNDPAAFMGNQPETTFDPFGASDMEWSQTYYWRIDQVNISNPTEIDRGDRWSFTITVPVCDPPMPFDVDGNCKIDLAEFAALAEVWLQCNWIPVERCD